MEHVTDANDLIALGHSSTKRFPKTTDRPTLIIVDSHIGYGSPHKQDTKEAHGEPLGAEEVKLTKKFYGWPEDAKFLVPDGVYRTFQERHRQARRRNARAWIKTIRTTTKQNFPNSPTADAH